jgi:acyl-CoA dehydrogenase
MNFEFSPEQLQLKQEVRRVLADLSSPAAVRQVLESGSGIDRSLWAILGEVGFLGAAIPEVYGGSGAGYLELCAIAEEVGRANAAIPLSSSICLGAELLLAAGSPAQKAHWLPRLARGTSVACVALAEGPGAIDERGVHTRWENGRLEGCKTAVLDGGVADLAIVTALHHGRVVLALLSLDEEGVERTPLTCIDPSRSQARIRLSGARAELLAANAWPVLEKALDRAAVLAAFEQLGGAERAMEMARDYALERYAFGRAIGSFQAIKHKLADMYVAVVLARSNCYYGAWALAEDAVELPEAAAAARVSATQAAQLCAKENIQVHGGMGFTWEFDCHLYYRRAHLMALVLGGLGQWQDRLVQQLRARRNSHHPLAHGL